MKIAGISWKWYMASSFFFLNFIYLGHALWIWGFPSGSENKESTCNSRDLGSIPG